jgi:hypothetical protein
VSVLPTEERIFESRRCGWRLDVMTGNGGRGSPGAEESALATLRERCPREGRLSGIECPVLFILESTRFRSGSINETAGRASPDLRLTTGNGQLTQFGRAGTESYLPSGGVVFGVISVGSSIARGIAGEGSAMLGSENSVIADRGDRATAASGIDFSIFF